MKLATIIDECQKVMGWFTPDQMRAFYPLVKDLKGTLVEIGTYHGKSTKFWRLASKLKITTIDIIDDPAPPIWFAGYVAGVKIDPEIEALGNIKVIQKDNREVVKKWKKPIDVLFIDGDERHDSIYGDMEAWWPFVKSGGMMFIHNYYTGNQETMRAVDEWYDKHDKQVGEPRLMADVWVVTKK